MSSTLRVDATTWQLLRRIRIPARYRVSSDGPWITTYVQLDELPSFTSPQIRRNGKQVEFAASAVTADKKIQSLLPPALTVDQYLPVPSSSSILPSHSAMGAGGGPGEEKTPSRGLKREHENISFSPLPPSAESTSPSMVDERETLSFSPIPPSIETISLRMIDEVEDEPDTTVVNGVAEKKMRMNPVHEMDSLGKVVHLPTPHPHDGGSGDLQIPPSRLERVFDQTPPRLGLIASPLSFAIQLLGDRDNIRLLRSSSFLYHRFYTTLHLTTKNFRFPEFTVFPGWTILPRCFVDRVQLPWEMHSLKLIMLELNELGRRIQHHEVFDSTMAHVRPFWEHIVNLIGDFNHAITFSKFIQQSQLFRRLRSLVVVQQDEEVGEQGTSIMMTPDIKGLFYPPTINTIVFTKFFLHGTLDEWKTILRRTSLQHLFGIRFDSKSIINAGPIVHRLSHYGLRSLSLKNAKLSENNLSVLLHAARTDQHRDNGFGAQLMALDITGNDSLTTKRAATELALLLKAATKLTELYLGPHGLSPSSFIDTGLDEAIRENRSLRTLSLCAAGPEMTQGDILQRILFPQSLSPSTIRKLSLVRWGLQDMGVNDWVRFAALFAHLDTLDLGSTLLNRVDGWSQLMTHGLYSMTSLRQLSLHRVATNISICAPLTLVLLRLTNLKVLVLSSCRLRGSQQQLRDLFMVLGRQISDLDLSNTIVEAQDYNGHRQADIYQNMNWLPPDVIEMVRSSKHKPEGLTQHFIWPYLLPVLLDARCSLHTLRASNQYDSVGDVHIPDQGYWIHLFAALARNKIPSLRRLDLYRVKTKVDDSTTPMRSLTLLLAHNITLEELHVSMRKASVDQVIAMVNALDFNTKSSIQILSFNIEDVWALKKNFDNLRMKRPFIQLYRTRYKWFTQYFYRSPYLYPPTIPLGEPKIHISPTRDPFLFVESSADVYTYFK